MTYTAPNIPHRQKPCAGCRFLVGMTNIMAMCGSTASDHYMHYIHPMHPVCLEWQPTIEEQHAQTTPPPDGDPS